MGRDLWLFDEPESGLSFQGQLHLVKLLLEHVQGGGQVILCMHSSILMALDNALLLEIGEWGVRQTTYDDLEVVFSMTTLFAGAPTVLTAFIRLVIQ